MELWLNDWPSVFVCVSWRHARIPSKLHGKPIYLSYSCLFATYSILFCSQTWFSKYFSTFKWLTIIFVICIYAARPWWCSQTMPGQKSVLQHWYRNGNPWSRIDFHFSQHTDENVRQWSWSCGRFEIRWGCGPNDCWSSAKQQNCRRKKYGTGTCCRKYHANFEC